MPDALHDIAAIGVPHKMLRASVSEANLASLGLANGLTLAWSSAASDQAERRFGFAVSQEIGNAARLAMELAGLGCSAAMLDPCSAPVLTAMPQRGNAAVLAPGSARRFAFSAANGSAAAFHYGVIEANAGRQTALLARSARLVCIEDRMWDVENGPAFVRLVIEMARKAGRKTVLLCQDNECIFRNHQAMRSVSDSGIDYLVGEAETLLLLHRVQRLDSLVPRLRSLHRGAILWRDAHVPIVMENDAVLEWSGLIEAMPSTVFWQSFAPVCLAELARSGSLQAFMTQEGQMQRRADGFFTMATLEPAIIPAQSMGG
jgi:hypothetical protein